MLCTHSGTRFVGQFEVGSGKKRHFSCYIQLVIAVHEILIPDSLYCTLALLSILLTTSYTQSSSYTQSWYTDICYLITAMKIDAPQLTTSYTQSWYTCICHLITAMKIDATQLTTSMTQSWYTDICYLITAMKIDAPQLTTSYTQSWYTCIVTS